ncbi:SMI1/KNR4 family protein [Pseudomonas frederiksbergensis]|uniref:SMI1/KNR4 family protein n=1 Tax=Pseudomonas frederiksbergensis TaxID=104087 RepID=UPI003D192E08
MSLIGSQQKLSMGGKGFFFTCDLYENDHIRRELDVRDIISFRTKCIPLLILKIDNEKEWGALALDILSQHSISGAGTCISEFYSFSPSLKAGTIVWHTRVAGLPTGWVAIARDAGDCLICLTFNTRSTTVEMFDPESGSTGFVANSFNDFVGLWRE